MTDIAASSLAAMTALWEKPGICSLGYWI